MQIGTEKSTKSDFWLVHKSALESNTGTRYVDICNDDAHGVVHRAESHNHSSRITCVGTLEGGSWTKFENTGNTS
jgi:hypothetical protein